MNVAYHDYLSVLTADIVGATPADRFFFISFLRTVGLETAAELSQKNIEEMTGLSRYQIREAIKHFKKNGIIQASTTRSTVGKIRSRLLCLAPPPQMPGLGAPMDIFHRERIHHVLFDELPKTISKAATSKLSRYESNASGQKEAEYGDQESPPGHNQLDLTSKLLLAILLRHADVTGKVQTLGMADLSHLLGRSEDRVRHHLSILEKTQYISSWVSGTSSFLLGQKKNIYTISITSDTFAPLKSTSKTYFYNYHHDEAMKMTEAQMAFTLADTSRYPRSRQKGTSAAAEAACQIEYCSAFLAIEQDFSEIQEYFTKGPESEDCRYYQAMLEQYASYLVNHHRHELESAEYFDSKELLTHITKDLTSAKSRIMEAPPQTASLASDCCEESLPKTAALKLMNFTYGTAFKMATNAYGWVKRISDIDLNDYHYVIGRQVGRGSCTVELIKK